MIDLDKFKQDIKHFISENSVSTECNIDELLERFYNKKESITFELECSENKSIQCIMFWFKDEPYFWNKIKEKE